MNFSVYADRLNYIDDILAIYDDTINLVFNLFNLDQTDYSVSGDSIVINFAKKNSTDLVKSYTGTVVENSVTFSIDTSELPSCGDYSYQVRNTTDDFTFCYGMLSLRAIIE